MVFQLNKLEFPSPKDALCQIWLKLAQWFWRRRFLNFVNIFSLFHYYLLLEKVGALHLNKLKSPSPNDALCQVWVKLAQWFWERRFFRYFNYFHYIIILSPWNRAGLFICTNLNPLYPRMICAKFG